MIVFQNRVISFRHEEKYLRTALAVEPVQGHPDELRTDPPVSKDRVDIEGLDLAPVLLGAGDAIALVFAATIYGSEDRAVVFAEDRLHSLFKSKGGEVIPEILRQLSMMSVQPLPQTFNLAIVFSIEFDNIHAFIHCRFHVPVPGKFHTDLLHP